MTDISHSRSVVIFSFKINESFQFKCHTLYVWNELVFFLEMFFKEACMLVPEGGFSVSKRE